VQCTSHGERKEGSLAQKAVQYRKKGRKKIYKHNRKDQKNFTGRGITQTIAMKTNVITADSAELTEIIVECY
jgi:hypothetical protein